MAFDKATNEQPETPRTQLANEIHSQLLSSSQDQLEDLNLSSQPLSADLQPLFRDSLQDPSSFQNPEELFHVIPGADEKEPYLLLIVHGIGSIKETQNINKNDFDQCVASLIQGGYVAEMQFQFMTHVIDWKSIVDESQQRQQLQRTSINNEVENARAMFNLTAPDVLQYLSPSYQQTIQQIVISKANMAYQQMFQHHPRFKGRVSMIAHSLGTVISYDLLKMQSEPKLCEELTMKFEIENFFLLGSPVGMFVSVYQPLESKVPQKLPKCKQFYNIYHPCDLIACRIEPIMQNETDILPPVLVPCYWNSGLNKASKMLKYMGSTLMQFITRTDNTGGNDQQTGIERRDYMIQERGFESFVKTLGLIHSHTSYFTNKDVANFILMKIHNRQIQEFEQ